MCNKIYIRYMQDIKQNHKTHSMARPLGLSSITKAFWVLLSRSSSVSSLSEVSPIPKRVFIDRQFACPYITHAHHIHTEESTGGILFSFSCYVLYRNGSMHSTFYALCPIFQIVSVMPKKKKGGIWPSKVFYATNFNESSWKKLYRSGRSYSFI